MKFSLLPSTFVAVISCAALPLQAAAINNIDEIVITSSRLPIPLRQVGSSVTRLDQSEIAERGFLSVTEVLRTLPAVAVSNSGGLGQPTALRIRGEEGFRTLVLIDGIDISDPTAPQVIPQVQHLPSAGIASVEILRGPQGMMYGADAGGVVSLRTPRPEDAFFGRLQIDGGRYDTQQQFAEVGGRAEQASFYLSGNRLESEGFNARRDDDVLKDNDGYENTTLHGRAAWDFSDTLRLQAVLRDVSASSEYDGCGWPTMHDCSSDFDQRSGKLNLDFRAAAVDHSIGYQRSNLESEHFAGGLSSFGSEGHVSKAEYLGSAKLGDAAGLVFGIDHKREEIRSDNEDFSRGQLGYFAEYQGSFAERLFVTAGLRQDDNDDFGRHGSYRLSAAWLLPLGEDVLKFKASAGNGFRAPSINELLYNAGPWASAAAASIDLQEEQSRGWDAGIEYFIAGHTQVEAVYFDQRIEDEIYFDSGYLQASGENKSSGLELSFEHQSSSLWAVSANFTYNDTETEQGDPRIRRAKHLGNVRLALYPLADLSLHLNWRSSRKALASDGSRLDNYALTDIAAQYELMPAIALFARVENIFREDYEEVLGYNTSGRAAYLGARFSF